MSEYRAIYKCRLCGEEFKGSATTNIDIAIKNMLNVTFGYEIKQWNEAPVSEIFMHSCKDGSLGLADFLGFRKVDDE